MTATNTTTNPTMESVAQHAWMLPLRSSSSIGIKESSSSMNDEMSVVTEVHASEDNAEEELRQEPQSASVEAQEAVREEVEEKTDELVQEMEEMIVEDIVEEMVEEMAAASPSPMLSSMSEEHKLSVAATKSKSREEMVAVAPSPSPMLSMSEENKLPVAATKSKSREDTDETAGVDESQEITVYQFQDVEAMDVEEKNSFDRLKDDQTIEIEYDNAFEYLSNAAELGDVEAHFQLSTALYQNGEGVENIDKIISHLEKAAIGGHPKARRILEIVQKQLTQQQPTQQPEKPADEPVADDQVAKNKGGWFSSKFSCGIVEPVWSAAPDVGPFDSMDSGDMKTEPAEQPPALQESIQQTLSKASKEEQISKAAREESIEQVLEKEKQKPDQKSWQTKLKKKKKELKKFFGKKKPEKRSSQPITQAQLPVIVEESATLKSTVTAEEVASIKSSDSKTGASLRKASSGLMDRDEDDDATFKLDDDATFKLDEDEPKANDESSIKEETPANRKPLSLVNLLGLGAPETKETMVKKSSSKEDKSHHRAPSAHDRSASTEFVGELAPPAHGRSASTEFVDEFPQITESISSSLLAASSSGTETGSFVRHGEAKFDLYNQKFGLIQKFGKYLDQLKKKQAEIRAKESEVEKAQNAVEKSTKVYVMKKKKKESALLQSELEKLKKEEEAIKVPVTRLYELLSTELDSDTVKTTDQSSKFEVDKFFFGGLACNHGNGEEVLSTINTDITTINTGITTVNTGITFDTMPTRIAADEEEGEGRVQTKFDHVLDVICG